MNAKNLLSFGIIALIALALGWGLGSHRTTKNSISVRTTADYLHAVIEADRTFYTQHVVERMEAMLIVTASEDWREDKTLPLPAQFLQEASRSLNIRKAPFRFRLVSPWPLNPKNGPTTEEEKSDIQRVVTYGDVVEDEIEMNGIRYYQAIYPDRAISRACVSCHNAHEKSPKRDFKLNDVMGGLLIQVPLD